MLKKLVKFNLVLVFIISLIGSVYFAAKDIKVRNWHKTTLTVTLIGLPDGNVFGDYTDANGVQHKNEPVFIKSSFSRYKTKVEQYYGKTFTILDNPETGLIVNYDDLFRDSIIFFGMTALSGILLFLSIKYQGKHRG